MIGLKKANAKYNTTFISHMVRKICNENSDLSKTVNESPKLGLSKISKSESLKSQQKETMHSWDLLSFLGDKKTCQGWLPCALQMYPHQARLSFHQTSGNEPKSLPGLQHKFYPISQSDSICMPG
jgi:hypothetical protein